MDRSLKLAQRHWDVWGKKDPLFAVLSLDDKRRGQWDPDEFFETGRSEIRELLERIDSLPIGLSRRVALDFGCGVGRLTQALSEYYDLTIGVDIAPSMIELANSYNKQRDRCRYDLNKTSDLRQYRDGMFDLIYSNIVLQHVPSRLSRQYVAEFVRILSPGGVAVFHCPSQPEPGSVTTRSQARRVVKEGVRFAANTSARALRRPIPYPKMLMSGIPRDDVFRIVGEAGGDVLVAQLTPWGAPGWIAYTYYVTKAGLMAG